MIYIILLLSATLQIIGIDTRPLDGDEGVILKVAYNSWGELIAQAAKDVHPPLFHLLLKPFIDWLGIYPWSGRMLSAILGVVLVYLVYQLVKKLFSSNKLALLTAFFTAISSYLIYPSQEIRMYMLFAVLTLSSYYYFYHVIELILNKTSVPPKHWFFYTISSTAMVYTQYLGFVVLISQFSYLIFLGFKTKFKYCRSHLLKWFLSYLIMAALFFPQLKTLLAQFFARITEQSQALSLTANLGGLIGAFYRFGSGRLFLDLDPQTIKDLLVDNPWVFIGFTVTIIIPLVLLAKGLVISYKKYQTAFWFLIVPFIIAILLAIASTEVGGRANRYLIYLFPFYIILVGLASLDFWKSKWWKVVPVMFILINLLGLYHHYFIENKAPGANKISQYIHNNYQVDDIVLIRGGFGGGEEFVFNYYWPEPRLEIPVVDMFGEYQIGNLAQLKAVTPQDKANELLQNYRRVWFYDMTYSNYQIRGIRHNLGQDKENKDLIVWEINK